MSRWILISVCMFFCAFSLSASPESVGAFVEMVKPGSPVEKAGIMQGDILVSWIRESTDESDANGKSGEFRSAFDLGYVMIEELPAGPVSVRVRRGESETVIDMPRTKWDLTVMPVLEPEIISELQKARTFAKEEHYDLSAEIYMNLYAKFEKQNPSTAVWFLFDHAKSFIKNKQAGRILGTLSKGIDKAVSENLKNAAFEMMIVKGLAYMYMNDMETAYKVFTECAEYERKISGQTLALVFVLNKTGWLSSGRGDYEGAREAYNEAVEIVENIAPVSESACSAYNAMGSLLLKMSRFEEASSYFEKALDIITGSDPSELWHSRILNNLGLCNMKTGRYEQAIDFYDRSLAISEKNDPESSETALCLANKSLILVMRGDYDSAAQFCEKSLKIKQKLFPGTVEVAQASVNLGLIKMEQGHLDAAETLFESAYDILVHARGDEHSLEVSQVLNNMGIIHKRRGDFQKAFDLYDRSVRIKETLSEGSVELLAGYVNLAKMVLSENQYDAAGDYLNKALSICNAHFDDSIDKALVLHEMARLAMKTGDLGKSEAFLKSALDICSEYPRSNITAAVLKTEAELKSSQGKFEEAAEIVEKAVHISEKFCSLSSAHAEIEHEAALIHRKSGDNEKALSFYRKAVETLEKQRDYIRCSSERETFAALYSDYYRELIDIQISQGLTKKAFGDLEAFRASELLVMLAERDIDFTGDAPEGILKEYRALIKRHDELLSALNDVSKSNEQEEIGKISSEIEVLRKRKEYLVEEMKKQSPGYFSLCHPEKLDAEQAAIELGKKDLLVSYCAGEDALIIFSLYNGALEAIRTEIKRDELANRIRSFRALFSSTESGIDVIQEQGKSLYRILLGKLGKKTARCGRIIICPDGPLHQLPFECLTDSRGRFLIQNKAVSYAISVSVMKTLSSVSASGGKIIAFGDPVYEGTLDDSLKDPNRSRGLRDGLAELPASGIEMDHIRNVFNDRAEIYRREKADEGTVLEVAGKAAYLHFACHGILDEHLPLESGIALSFNENGAENGFLQVWEIFEKLKLNANLVTLSACETGLGREMGGEGLIGLTRAFHYAGASSVISTLWSVEDESTAEFIRLFYSGMTKSESVSEALRSAKRGFIEGKEGINIRNRAKQAGKHPFYWGAFICSGR